MLVVGIDVGGTFTDVVAVDAATRALVARIKVPTTHDAPGGVAEGIVAGNFNLSNCGSVLAPPSTVASENRARNVRNIATTGEPLRRLSRNHPLEHPSH